MKIIEKTVDKLIPYINNARTHNDEQVTQIASSIKEFGFNNPILLDGENGVIAGHGRLLAAKKLGLKKVPCIELSHLSEAQKKAYILADNKIALNSDWDNELLNIELGELDADLRSLAGFSDEELSEIVIEEPTTNNEKADEIPEEVEPKCKLGQIWQLGEHRLMCGDSTDGGAVALLMDEDRADLWLTDPPYNVALGIGESVEEAKKRRRRTDGLTIMNDKMPDQDFLNFLVNCFSAAKEVMKNGASFYIWHAYSEGLNFRQALKNIELTVRQTLIWNKNTISLGRQDYQWKHEPCLYGWKEGAAHNWYSDRKQSTVIDFNKPTKSELHPTMKPVGLFEYLIINSSKKGDIVLDNFGGSGTTLIACEQMGRKARLMELDPHYCDVIIQRWEDLTGKKAELIEG